MGKTADKKVALSPIMKEVIEKMREGYRLEAEGHSVMAFWLLGTTTGKRLNWNTAYFMKRRGLIEHTKTDKGFWGTKYIYELTDLGKSIQL